MVELPTNEMKALRLLLVEDHVDSAELMAELLSGKGHVVHVAGTASDALALADQHPIDIVVSDVGLPDASGYDLMAELRTRHALKGIALSGSDVGHESRAAGFSVHLTKPVSLRALEQALLDVAAQS